MRLKNRLIGSCAVVLVLSAANRSPADQPTTSAGPPEQRYALLIGVNEYSPPLEKLAYCQNDMVALRERLMVAGFAAKNIRFLHDGAEEPRLRPTKANIEHALQWLQFPNEQDLVFVAFSGHGLQLEGQSYLCPSDANLTPGSMVLVDEVYRQLIGCRAGRKLLVVDACRNEPLVRGFRSSEELRMQLAAPPKGLLVLASAEAGQYSAECSELQHGVFMYYIIKGLEGEADRDRQTGGNQDGRVSVDELYHYAHEKTKQRVWDSHGFVQLPAMRMGGEMVGKIELAVVPDRQSLEELAKREKDRETQKPVAQDEGHRGHGHPLLQQADNYYRQADYANAILAYTAIIDDPSVPIEVRREARKSRGASYLTRGGKDDIDRALIDQKAAELPGIQLVIRAATARLQVGKETKGTVNQGQVVLVTEIRGDWLWVASVSGDTKLQGYIRRDTVIQPPPAPKPRPAQVATQPAAQPSYSSGYGYDETPGQQTIGNRIDRLEDQLDTAYERDATDGRIRSLERQIENQERLYDRRGGRQ